MSIRELDQRLITVVPSERQIAHQSLEFYGFVHFTVNTFTDKEWGDGTEDERIFNPQKLDAGQWADAFVEAGMKGMILTCKHHDGFCLWPSKYTKHTIAASPFRGGKGDLVKEAADACRERGLAFGIYLSPWDRNQETYGSGDAYNDFFVNQLTELLTNYGEIFTVWFDGACGEGSNGKKQVYDWERYYEVIRRLQPNACISVCGPDVRWCGNEAGDTRVSEWSVVPLRTRDTEKIAEKSQQADDTEFRTRVIRAQDADLGSREIMKNEQEAIWYPAEVNTSIRPGWFYHASEDEQVRSLETLMHIYLGSVGGNSTFLLNIPPTKDGLIHENDRARLREFGACLKEMCAFNLTGQAGIHADSFLPGHGVEALLEDSYDSWFESPDGKTDPVIEFVWPQVQSIRYVVLKENIRLSQRIESFSIEAGCGNEWQEVWRGTVVGYKRIVSLTSIKTDRLRIRILDARVAPTLSFVGVYA